MTQPKSTKPEDLADPAKSTPLKAVASGKPKPAAKSAAKPAHVRPPATNAVVKRRHWGVLVSFVLMVAVPTVLAQWYLWEHAKDQYASTVAFSVRTEEVASPVELLGGITGISGSGSVDADILYAFIQSQELVSRVDNQLDLRRLWSKPEGDPIFVYDPTGSIEDLVDFWNRMVRIYYDSSSGLIEIRVKAFAAEDAANIAGAILAESSQMINSLNEASREDTLRYTREELDTAIERLKATRTTLTAFRNRTQVVDPAVDMQTQAGLLGSLQAQQAEALIELDLLVGSTQSGDPRIEQARRRVNVIEARIADERRKLGIGDGSTGGEVFADLVGEYERLEVDRQFAEQAYLSAMAGYDAALADVRRQSRYLAAHILPTTAERALYPQRLQILSMVTVFSFLTWAISVLVAYSFRDRR